MELCILQDGTLQDMADQAARVWIGDATFAHCTSFQTGSLFGDFRLDDHQVRAGVCALLSERYGHPAWALQSRVLPCHWSAQPERIVQEMINHHEALLCYSKLGAVEIGVSVLATKSHTMGAIHMRGTMLAVDGRIEQHAMLPELAEEANETFTKVFGFPVADTKIDHPWVQADKESCGYFFLHYLHHRLFHHRSIKYEQPPDNEMSDTWIKMAWFFDTICKERLGMTMEVDATWVGARMR
jgi:hypothetical protein